MNSSSELLQKLAQAPGSANDPGFEVIVAFDYYDGPEHGLALYPSGEGVRFSSLGDSKSRFFRAFELIPIKGTWWPQIKSLQQAAGIDPPRRILVPSEPSDELGQLENDVLQAPAAIGQFVGVGSPDLEKLSICAVSQKQLETLRELGCSPAGFQLAHQLVKGRAAEEV
jgi:hypothetical protein